MADVRTEMFNELRESIPHQEDWQEWLGAVAQVIASYPTEQRQRACIVLIANDVGAVLDVPWWEICQPIQCAVDKRKAVTS